MGRAANFNARYGKALNPMLPEEWNNNTKDRRLSQEFIETILLHDPWQSAIHRRGVRIEGAFFPGGLNLSGAKIGHEVWLYRSRLLGAFVLSKSSLNNLIVLDGSTFEGDVIMDTMQLAGNLFMRSANFKYSVNMNSAKVGGISMNSSIFERGLTMDSLQVAGHLYMAGKASFKGEVVMNGAKVGGTLDVGDSTFEGELIMQRLQVEDNLFMRNASFSKMVDLIFAKIGGDLDLPGALLTELDLTGANIVAELRLGSGNHDLVRWRNGGRLILRNTHVGAFQDRLSDDGDAWPAEVQLDGFTYDRLGGLLGGGLEADMMSRDTTWYIDWLKRDPSYSPQPYEQLANAFRAAGHSTKANDILFSGRDRELGNATGAARLGLGVLKWTIGFGLGTGYFRSLWWVAGLVILGMLVLRISGEGRRNQMPWGFSFSLDHLLPVIKLREYHFDISLEGWARYYFYIHKLMGYVLASFLLAGLAGLTQ